MPTPTPPTEPTPPTDPAPPVASGQSARSTHSVRAGWSGAAAAGLGAPTLRPAPGMVGVFESVEAAFVWLVSGPAPLSVPGESLGPDLPRRQIPLHQLRVRLACAKVSHRTQARVWAYLVHRARRGPHQPAWTVGLAGIALPDLARAVTALVPSYPGDLDDLQAAALAAFLTEMRAIDLAHLTAGYPGIRHRLLTAARHGARAARDTKNQAKNQAKNPPPHRPRLTHSPRPRPDSQVGAQPDAQPDAQVTELRRSTRPEPRP